METTSGNKTINLEKVEAFLGRALSDFGASFGTTLSYIGDKLGLYKAMAYAGPLSSVEVARRSGTHERYVREWLINQAAGGYIEYDPESGKYLLPDEHAVALTNEDSPFFIAGFFQLVNGMFKADERIIEHFLSGGGMKWGEHHHNLFHGTERFFKPSYLGHLVQNWIPALEGLENRLHQGIRVADIGCGHGISTLILAKAFPNSDFTGFDFHAASIERANNLAREKNLQGNLRFQVAASTDFPGEKYGLITFFDCLHDMGNPVGALKHCHEQLEDDGVIMAVEPMAGRTVEENFNPVGRIFSGASVLCCTPNALATGGYALGTIATDDVLAEVVGKAGFTRFKRATETPVNRIFEIRK